MHFVTILFCVLSHLVSAHRMTELFIGSRKPSSTFVDYWGRLLTRVTLPAACGPRLPVASIAPMPGTGLANDKRMKGAQREATGNKTQLYTRRLGRRRAIEQMQVICVKLATTLLYMRHGSCDCEACAPLLVLTASATPSASHPWRTST